MTTPTMHHKKRRASFRILTSFDFKPEARVRIQLCKSEKRGPPASDLDWTTALLGACASKSLRERGMAVDAAMVGRIARPDRLSLEIGGGPGGERGGREG